MKHCSSCGREIPESATVCEPCDRWAADPVALPIPDATPEHVAAPSAQASVAPPAPADSVSRHTLLVILLAVVVVGIITLALLMVRGVPSSEVAAAPVQISTREPSSHAGLQPASPVSQKWNSENRASWVGTRRKSAAFELPAENLVSVWLRQVRPMLVVRCVSKTTEVFIVTGSAIKMEPQTEDHTVTVRLDDEPVLTERWPDSIDHDALFAPDGAAFAQRLIRARTLQFGYTPHNVSSVAASFQVGGLGELIDPVAKECGWKK